MECPRSQIEPCGPFLMYLLNARNPHDRKVQKISIQIRGVEVEGRNGVDSGVE